MNDISSIALACCGFGGVCCGSLAVVLYLVARTTGIALLMPAANMLTGMLFSDSSGDDENSYKSQGAAAKRSSFRDRVQAQSSKFNPQQAQSQSRFGQQTASSQQGRRIQRPALSNDPFASNDEDDGGQGDYDPFGVPGLRGGSSRSSRPRRDTRRGGSQDRDDEIFGGFLDDEGDGFPDF